MNDFLKDIIKITGNEYADLVSEGVAAGDVDNFVDTGSYVFNALLSGSLYGGLPANKITALAKTAVHYILSSIVSATKFPNAKLDVSLQRIDNTANENKIWLCF